MLRSNIQLHGPPSLVNHHVLAGMYYEDIALLRNIYRNFSLQPIVIVQFEEIHNNIFLLFI